MKLYWGGKALFHPSRRLNLTSGTLVNANRIESSTRRIINNKITYDLTYSQSHSQILYEWLNCSTNGTHVE